MGESVFARIARVRRRAAQLLGGHKTVEPVSEAETADLELRLPRLASLFALSPLAVDTIVCLIAAEYDPFLRLLIRAVQREQGRPYLELGTISELLELPPSRVPELARLFQPDSPLVTWALVGFDETTLEAPLVSLRVRLSSRIARHLVGQDQLPDGMALHPPAQLDEPSLPPEIAARVYERVRCAMEQREPLVVEIAGPAGCGKQHFARALAARLSQPLVIVDLSTVPREGLARALAAGRREARLAEALLCFARWDAHKDLPLPSDEPAPPRPRSLPPALAALLQQLEGVVLLTAVEREPLLEMGARSIVHADVRFPSPSRRAALLMAALRQNAAPDVDPHVLARRFALDPGRIVAAARGALELARERDARQVSAVDLGEACRRQLQHDLESVAVRVTSSHRWEDLVIPVDVYYALQEMVAYRQHAEMVYGQWGFGGRHDQRRGISALFAGPSGTGKTMCASVMAREMDMELFQVDLSRVVSKWIGETEKNLAKVFDEAERSNAIILFDEADSLFARRTEIKSSVDRYANLEVNFLLQRMEAFTGVTILTTNFEDTIDTAFKRRLTFRVRFEKPDAEARAALWAKMFPADCRLADDIDFTRLAAQFEMSGAHIRNACLRAAFLAAAAGGPIDMSAVMQAAERECREMGLLVRSEIPTPSQFNDEVELPQPLRLSSVQPKLVPISHPRR
jgi:hypothetical protein